MRRGEKEAGGLRARARLPALVWRASQSAADFADEMRIAMFRLGVDNPWHFAAASHSAKPAASDARVRIRKSQLSRSPESTAPLIQRSITLAKK